MFSLPQSSDVSDVERPVVDLSEDSQTIDPLLRFCYPVNDPSFLPPDRLSDILGVAMKYDFTEAISTATGMLYGQVPLLVLFTARLGAATARLLMALPFL